MLLIKLEFVAEKIYNLKFGTSPLIISSSEPCTVFTQRHVYVSLYIALNLLKKLESPAVFYTPKIYVAYIPNAYAEVTAYYQVGHVLVPSQLWNK